MNRCITRELYLSRDELREAVFAYLRDRFDQPVPVAGSKEYREATVKAHLTEPDAEDVERVEISWTEFASFESEPRP